MSLRSLLFIVMAIYSLDASAGAVRILGQSINAAIPTGYCEVGDNPADAEFVKLTKQGVGNSNQILVIFADCKELKDFREGKSQLKNYGNIQVQTPNGKTRPRVLRGVSREYYIQKLSSMSGDWSEAIQTAEAKAKQFEPTLRVNENLGVLTTDTNGLYIGLLFALNDKNGDVASVIGITGMTLIKEMSLSINLYHVYSKSPDLRGLLARQQSAIANLVEVNE